MPSSKGVASHAWVMQPGGPDTCIKCGVRLTEGAAAAPCRPVTLQPDADDTCVPPSEGLAELIERLAVATFKHVSCETELRYLTREAGEEVAELIKNLLEQNARLYALKDRQASAVRMKCENAGLLLRLLRRDLDLCKSRAVIRAELNRRLGQEASGESVKMYGNTDGETP